MARGVLSWAGSAERILCHGGEVDSIDGRRLIAMLALGIVLGFLALLAVVDRSEGLQSLEGSWVGEWMSPDGPVPVTMELPSLFIRAGLSPDSHVRLRRTVELTDAEERYAIWLERPMHVVQVRWDGRPLLPRGERAALDDRSLLLDLPRELGAHELELDLVGDYGRGGIVGRMWVGPAHQIEQVSRGRDNQRAGLALVLSILAVLHLSVAIRQPHRNLNLLLGLFCATFAVWSFAQSDLATLFGDPEQRHRFRRITIGLFPPFGMAFALTFLFDRINPRALGMLLIFGATSALGVILPTSWLFRLEVVQDAMLMVYLAGLIVVTLMAALQGRRGGWALLFTVLPPLVLAALIDIFAAYGILTERGMLLPAAVFFVLGMSVVLALRHAEDADRHERLVSGSPDALITVSRDGIIRSLNPSARRWIGARQGLPLADQLVLEDRGLLPVHLAGGMPRAELRLARSPDRVLESVATEMKGGEVLLLLRDVTRRRQLDSAMLQSARLETVGGMVGGIAHDFNNMLATLMAQLGLLQVTHDDAEGKERLERMEGTIERASLLVRRMLTLARGTSPELEPVDLVALCRTACQLVEPTLPAGVQLIVDVPADTPWVMGSRGDLEQVLVNLLLNARDVLGSEGTVAIRARRMDVGGDSALVVLVVEDDGPGVEDSRKADIFLPFISTKPPGRGSGLGLAVAAQIVRDHLGRLWVEDRPGGGARFLVALRVAPEEQVEPRPPSSFREVLLVEDEDALRGSYAEALRAVGFTVTTRATGDAGVDCLRRSRPDILVTDVVMPGCSGVDLADTCNRLYPEVPVILVSGYVPELGAGPLPSSWYRLDKPLRPSRLAAEVARIAQRSGRRHEQNQAADQDISVVMRGLDAEQLGLGPSPDDDDKP